MNAANAAPLTPDEVNVLATYNAEVYRGLAHNEAWRERMAELQCRFDTAGYLPRRRRKLRVGRAEE